MQKSKITRIILGVVAVFSINQTVYASSVDDPLLSMVVMDKLEILNNDEKTRIWEGSAWIGYDLNKLYVYTSGDATADGVESSQNEIVYSRAISPFWDAQIGIAYDKNADTSKTWAEVAISGLAPYYFESRAALLFGSDGNIGLRVGSEYEMLITQKFILTSSLEANFYTKDDSELGIGSGLSKIEAGLRLRYEIKREFAPYIGLKLEQTFGNTKQYNAINNTSILAGIRFWF